ncbi:leucyl aminopeptidase [candidate division WOR-1 bacterium DG_54_3]|uniref:Leucyl aminopeptidase n=1 Tax=candidate division WOR-1 bacterium DG_54_3 TaxID=1703775 RepID=A0A0S7Y0S8_UNCSA|nr:MAG: leucyl aminopeptidase [candidate division WOR-1 bacterium DG_54_3]
MPTTLNLELADVAYKVVRDITAVKKGESLLITVDSAGCWIVAEELAKIAESLGAKVMVAYHSTPVGVGKVTEPYLPDSLKAAIPQTDVWLELNAQWLGYSTPYEEALVPPDRVRYLCLCGLDVERMVRFFGRLDLKAQDEFQNKVVEVTKHARNMRITTPAGTDVSFENDPKRPVLSELWCHTPGAHFPLGQIAWAPIEESINGDIVFDCSFYAGGPADLPNLHEPITFRVKKGLCIEISGGEEAKLARQWLDSLNDPGMYHEAHLCYGFNPGAKPSGICVEDERIWGVTEWGFGHQGIQFKAAGVSAVSHLDGICLNSSVWQDGEQVLNEGKVVHPKLVELARKLGK